MVRDPGARFPTKRERAEVVVSYETFQAKRDAIRARYEQLDQELGEAEAELEERFGLSRHVLFNLWARWHNAVKDVDR
jgi:hypothetical protein